MMTSWDVFDPLNKKIDTVFFNPDLNKEWVKDSLVNHDGYDANITVKESQK